MSARSPLTDDQLEGFLRTRAVAPDVGLFDEIMGGVSALPQRRASWLTMPVLGRSRSALLLFAAALLTAIVAGAIAIGSGLVKLPSVLPSPSIIPVVSPSGLPSTTPEPTPAEPLGLVAYNVMQPVDPLPESCTSSTFHSWCQETRIWVANSDGSAAHELLPNLPGDQSAITWSPDGSRLLFSYDNGVGLTDPAGSAPEILREPALCPKPVLDHNCQAGVGDGAFSPDGTRLAYAILEGRQLDRSMVVVLDLATGHVSRLTSTGTNTASQPCLGQGDNGSPLWSPDGTRLIVTRHDLWPLDEIGNCKSIVFSVKSDGSDFAVVVPSGARRQPSSAGLSPDGSHLIVSLLQSDPQGGSDATCDIAIARPDGSHLRQLTSDGKSCDARWLRDGRILFTRWIDLDAGTLDQWLMDADGGNQTRLGDAQIAALTGISCTACPWPQGTDLVPQPIP